MFCKNCGAEINENAFACMSCGFAKGDGVKFCANCGKEINPGASICTNCGTSVKCTYSANGEQKSKLVAVLLAFFLGYIGIHDFYLGYNKYGVIKIILSLCTAGVVGEIWALIDFVRLLTGGISADANGVELKKEF